MMSQEHTYCLAIEKLLNCSIPKRAQYIRVLFAEITRILNHLLAVGCHAMDVGAMTPMLWGFQERQKLMEFYERVSGARMHAAFHKPIFLFDTFVDKQLIHDILQFTNKCYITLNEMHNVLTYNKI